MRVCAYCNLDGKMTREHIWPGSIIRKYEDMLTYNKSKHKFYEGEAVVKDVCKECNNVALGKLDIYLSGLFDSDFKKILDPGDAASLDYNYDLLLRVLLKISYNSARAAGNDSVVRKHLRFVEYILRGTHRGSVMLRLQVVTSAKMFIAGEADYEMSRPEILRCADIAYDGPLAKRFMVRMVAINCFWFYIIAPHKSEPEHKWKEFMSGFSQWYIQSGVLVSPALSRLDVPVNKTTYFDARLVAGLLDADR